MCTQHARNHRSGLRRRLQTAKRNAAKMEPVTNEKVEAAKEAAIGKATDLFKKGKSEIDKVGRARCLQPFPISFLLRQPLVLDRDPARLRGRRRRPRTHLLSSVCPLEYSMSVSAAIPP